MGGSSTAYIIVVAVGIVFVYIAAKRLGLIGGGTTTDAE